jgi:phosphomannomutase/phosphoglucomutase
MKSFDVIFREYDLRGTEEEGLNDEFARRLGWAFAEYLRERLKRNNLTVSVGRDVRLNSSSLAQSVSLGLREFGVDVLELGICPTPLLYFSLFTFSPNGGLMITGSHNPPEYNGFKVCVEKETISGKEIEGLKEIFLSVKKPDKINLGKIRKVNIIEKYLNYLKEEFAYLENKPKLKVAIDAGNGTAGIVVSQLFKKFGCEVIELFCEPDGNFPNHHPDPTVLSNLKTLRQVVVDECCDLGLAYDGDGDRLGVVDEEGKVIYGDKLMIVFSKKVVSQNPRAKILGEVKCSQVMYDEIEKMGGNPIMWKTGHSLIKKKMKGENALLAGEMSGHFFFADRYFGYDDAIYASCRLIEILKEEKEKGLKKFSQFFESLPSLFSTPEIRVKCPEEIKRKVVEDIKEKLMQHKKKSLEPHIKKLIFIDGVRILFENGWGLVRASNTQPVLVLRFEAESRDKMETYKNFIESLIRESAKEKEVV